MLIISERAYQHWASWDLVYEWEDELVKTFPDARLFCAHDFCINNKPVFGTLGGKIGFSPNTLMLGKREAFRFEMADVAKSNLVWNQSNISACVIDFYTKKEDLPLFYKMHSRLKQLYISSREVYEFLLANAPIREIQHLPLTLPDKYGITEDTKFDKRYDLVLVGRQNPVLIDYLHTYEKHHSISYVYRGKIDGGSFPYYSSQGEFVGYGNTRAEYFNLLRQGRVAFYSTPGVNDKQWTNGFHQVTPRFLEEIACGCHVISQFVDNPDTEYFELGKMSKRVTNYDDFEKAMEEALETPVNMAAYSAYLQKHYTSTYKNKFISAL